MTGPRVEASRASRARRSWRTLAVWTSVVAVLAVLGTGVAKRLTVMSLSVPGTPSARAEAILEQRFGDTISVAVLLQGSPQEIDTQGPALVQAFRHVPRVQVLSPWEGQGALGTLRPRPNAALIFVSYIRPESQAMSVVVPDAERVIAGAVHAPVHADLSGLPVIGRAIQEVTLRDTHRAELIALPILVIVLLLVFGSPVAAAVPLAVGGATVLAGRGLLWLATFVMPVNALGVSIATMMGLALGVDYALLMVSRVRQEQAAGADRATAIDTATRVAGRTILFAGGTLALAMLTAAEVVTGELLSSVALGVLFSGLLSVTLALLAMPALLRVLGEHLDRWRVGLPALRGGQLRGGLSRRLIAHPAVAIPLILLVLFALASPAGALRMGPPDVSQLPGSDPARKSFEAMQGVISPGWTAPFVVVATAHQGAIATSARLEAIVRWQETVAREPDVAAVIGPGSLPGEQRDLATAHRELAAVPSRLSASQRGIATLQAGLRRLARGVGQLRGGMILAANGAEKLGQGAQAARRGAASLHSGLTAASGGAGQLAYGLDRAKRGAGRLLSAEHRLSVGAAELARGMDTLDSSAHAALAPIDLLAGSVPQLARFLAGLPDPTQVASGPLATANSALEGMTVGRSDPRYGQLRHALSVAQTDVRSSATPMFGRLRESVVSGLYRLASLAKRLDQLVAGIDELTAGSHRLAAGTRATEHGARELRAGLARLQAGGHRLNSGLARLDEGAGQLHNGLSSLASGGRQLSWGLSDGARRAGALQTGVAAAQGPLHGSAVMLSGYQHNYGLLSSRSPDALDSGYLVLTALDGTVSPLRDLVAQAINVDTGGQAARIIVVPSSAPNTPATAALSQQLQRRLPALAAATGTTVGVGEGAQYMLDYTNSTTARFPWLVLALALVATLALIVVLRALLLPLISVALNLATIAAAFGALQLLFQGKTFGGSGYIDAASAAGIFAIMFVLSIDYEVFLLTRMREEWTQSGDNEQAIAHGLGHTAGVITGAAAIMTGVFLAFASADISSVRQFGVGLTIAVLLDATIVRLVFLPAIMRAIGPRVWWLPDWLDRKLPAIETGAPQPAAV
jgi:RND superfamily putative drug exporter